MFGYKTVIRHPEAATIRLERPGEDRAFFSRRIKLDREDRMGMFCILPTGAGRKLCGNTAWIPDTLEFGLMKVATQDKLTTILVKQDLLGLSSIEGLQMFKWMMNKGDYQIGGRIFYLCQRLSDLKFSNEDVPLVSLVLASPRGVQA